jgi:N-methylhydantoinase A
VVSATTAARLPVTTLLSGPAAGVVAAGAWARRVGRPNAVGFDVGGTSADVSVLTDGAPAVWREGQIGKYPLRTPMIAIHTIGAGGGSIAWRNRVGELRVGPESAGSTPGPAAYGRGGTLPTVTDASCRLGYMGEAIAGGRVRLARDAADAALATLGDPDDVAQGIHRILNARMADQIRLVTIRRGISPRSLALVAFGGAGPMHAVEVARQLGMREVIVPRHPGVLSAEGLLMAPADEERVVAGRFRIEEVPDMLAQLEQSVNGATIVSRAADMRYVGQAHELAVAVGGGGLRERFEELHEGLYGYRNPSSAVEAMSVRVGIRRRDPWQVVRYRDHAAANGMPPTTRRAWFPATGWLDTPVVQRPSLVADGALAGPAIVEDEDTTVVIPPGAVAVLHDSGALVVEVGA